jgi:AraC-like DNA-binding protein
MSPRTFARQFEGHFGMTPGRWVQSLRVESACAYLETHQLPIKAVARLTGFCDERSLRRAFQQQLGISPKEYRERLDLFDPQMIEDSTVVTVKNLQGSMKNHEYLVDRFPLGLNERPAEPLF